LLTLATLVETMSVLRGKGRRKASFIQPTMRVSARHLRGGDMLRHATLTAVLP
jgi:hypothetical protein